MSEPKRAVILLNMGGARSKTELKQFLKNMFLDRRIIPSFWRFLIMPLILIFRLNKVWKHYELIGGSKIYEHTMSLAEKVGVKLGGDFEVIYAMRYTSPTFKEAMQGKNYDKVLLFPLYPHFSSTTTLSSFDAAEEFFKDKGIDVLRVDYFFENESFNKTIISSIKKEHSQNAHLVFSAHSLPLSIAKNDKYESHIKKHINILTKMIESEGLKFSKIHLAYQSKIGRIKWLKPSLDEVLKNLSGERVVVYPISFAIDNTETDYELCLQYKDNAKDFGVDSYKVCKVQNDSDEFAEFLSKTAREFFR